LIQSNICKIPWSLGGKREISADGSGYPAWSRNGLFFWQFAAPNRLMVASYKARGDSFQPDGPRVWSKRITGFQHDEKL